MSVNWIHGSLLFQRFLQQAKKCNDLGTLESMTFDDLTVINKQVIVENYTARIEVVPNLYRGESWELFQVLEPQ